LIGNNLEKARLRDREKRGGALAFPDEAAASGPQTIARTAADIPWKCAMVSTLVEFDAYTLGRTGTTVLGGMPSDVIAQ
jgi:hypothetical protein